VEREDKFYDDLIRSLFPERKEPTLNELFEWRLTELKITKTDALVLLGMGQNTLLGILNGKQQLVNFLNIIKLANFLQKPKEKVIELYMNELERNHPIEQEISPEKVQFIKENFDLAALKKAKFIDSISDYKEIEKRIVYYFDLRSIFDYKKPPVEAAFSAASLHVKNQHTRDFFIKSAYDQFENIENPYEYSREDLITYFPEIRWHSTDVKFGLKTVIRALYKIGITVIYIPPMPTLHIKGATFAVNGKPCIVLTNYKGFYPTLWFTLIHELFHVLFDWEDIKLNMYHLSDDDEEQLSIIEKEREADSFARQYFLSKEKSQVIEPLIYSAKRVEEFALNNQIHSSFIYVFNAWDTNGKGEISWGKVRKLSPAIEPCIDDFKNDWSKTLSVSTFVKLKKFKIYS
jgi:HTH-type transcriptional regulator / antitoxin HigA